MVYPSSHTAQLVCWLTVLISCGLGDCSNILQRLAEPLTLVSGFSHKQSQNSGRAWPILNQEDEVYRGQDRTAVLSPSELVTLKEEQFLGNIFSKLGRPRHVGDWSQRVQSIREVFKNIKGKPGVVMPVDGKLTFNLEKLAGPEEITEFLVWIPSSWIYGPDNGAGLYVRQDLTKAMKTAVAMQENSFSFRINSNSQDQVFTDLVLNKQVRTKRGRQGSPRCGAEQNSCCLSSQNVNLTEIGWDFVLSPQIIDFSYCAGHCDPLRVPKSMFLTQMAALRWKLHKGGIGNLPAPCCSPHQFQSLEILYLDNLNPDGSVEVNVGSIEDVLATSCGCN